MMNHKKLFGLMAQHLQVKDFLQNAEKLYSYEQYSRYPDFEKSAQFCVEALLKAGFSDVESIPVPCDGVTSYMDHTMPQAWDRTGRCTLEILDQAVPEEFRMLCDSDRHPLEAGIWSPPTAPEGLTGEVVDGDAAGDYGLGYLTPRIFHISREGGHHFKTHEVKQYNRYIGQAVYIKRRKQ